MLVMHVGRVLLQFCTAIVHVATDASTVSEFQNSVNTCVWIIDLCCVSLQQDVFCTKNKTVRNEIIVRNSKAMKPPPSACFTAYELN